MFFLNRLKIVVVAVTIVTAFITCTKKWDDHDMITDQALSNSLAQVIANNPNLSKFNSLLVKSGYDKVIASTKTFTVWAPTDQALQSLDPSIEADTAKLKQFIANHITNQSYLVSSLGAGTRIKMLNGKFVVVSSTKFDSANIVNSNIYAGNGVVHTIDKFIPKMDNIWEFINNRASIAPAMRSFLLSLNHVVFDPTRATQTGVDPRTGLPVYDTASGGVIRNTFLDSVMNVSDETNQYTMILLDDNSYNAEFNKLTPWFVTSTPDSTNRMAGYWLVKDLVFKGVYTKQQLPDTIISQYGVKVPINKAAITASYQTSNGIVHVMSQVNFKLQDKFPPIIIQGENPSGFTTGDRQSNTFYRARYNPVTGQNFNDILMQNYNYANYYIRYAVKNLNSMRYNAYWVAVNDVQTTPLWQQRLGNGYTRNDTLFYSTLPAVTVQYKNYSEVLLGQFSFPSVVSRDILVFGPTTASNSGGNNSITVDYIKLEPAF